MAEKIRVLLIDDEENILWSLERALTHEGFIVRTARGAGEAIEILQSQEIDVAVTDVKMPGGDGFEFLRWASANRPGLRVIMATAYGSDSVRQAALSHGALHYLEKPVDIRALSALLRSSAAGPGFDASLRGLSLVDLVQFLVLAGATRSIEVACGDEKGTLTFAGGEIVSARVGDRLGDEALRRILRWRGGEFHEVEMPANVGRNVTAATRDLLAEAARSPSESSRRADRNGSSAQAARLAGKPAFRNEGPAARDARGGETVPRGAAGCAPGAVDTDDPVEIARDVWWVGYRNPRTLLQCNAYLRVFRGSGSTVNCLIDPGSPLDLPVVSRKIGQVIGDMSRIHVFTLNHQDPDVVTNSVYIQRMNPKAICVTSEDTWRLVMHHELDPARVRFVERFPDARMRMKTGHVVRFVPTPYCHFRGAVALYDVETRVLFSGDLLGGLSPSGHRALYATESSWDGVRAFHQIYMPARRVLRHAVAKIRALEPAPWIIAPQHGDILRGPILEEFLHRIEELPVGADLFEDSEDARTLDLARDAANDVLAFGVTLFGPKAVAGKLDAGAVRARLAGLASVAGTSVGAVHRAPADVLALIEEALSAGEGFAIVNQLRMAAIKAAVQRNLPVRTGQLHLEDAPFDDPEDPVLA